MSPVRSSPGISPSRSSVSSFFVDDLRTPRSSFTPTRSIDSIDETWDVVEDLPLRWALDYVSLAISGSRLANTSVLFYDIWSDPTISGRKGALLAVATKSTILLYETPKGERAFRFVKVSHSRSSFVENFREPYSPVPIPPLHRTWFRPPFREHPALVHICCINATGSDFSTHSWVFIPSRNFISLPHLEQCGSCINPSPTLSREVRLM